MAKENDEPNLKTRFVHRARIGNRVYEAVLFDIFPSFPCYEKDKGFSLAQDIQTETERLLPVLKEMVPYRPLQSTRRLENKLFRGYLKEALLSESSCSTEPSRQKLSQDIICRRTMHSEVDSSSFK